MENHAVDQTGLDQGQTDRSPVSEKVRRLEEKISTLEARRKAAFQFTLLAFFLCMSASLMIQYNMLRKFHTRLDTRTLVAEEIYLRNRSNKNEIVLTFDDQHNPTIRLHDERRRNRMTICLAQDGVPVIAFFDERGRLRLNVCARSIDGQGCVVASFGSSHNYKGLELGVAPGDLPFFQLNDDLGRNRMLTRIMEDGKSVLQLTNPEGTGRIQLLSAPDMGPSTLKIIGKDEDTYSISK